MRNGEIYHTYFSGSIISRRYNDRVVGYLHTSCDLAIANNDYIDVQYSDTIFRIYIICHSAIDDTLSITVYDQSKDPAMYVFDVKCKCCGPSLVAKLIVRELTKVMTNKILMA